MVEIQPYSEWNTASRGGDPQLWIRFSHCSLLSKPEHCASTYTQRSIVTQRIVASAITAIARGLVAAVIVMEHIVNYTEFRSPLQGLVAETKHDGNRSLATSREAGCSAAGAQLEFRCQCVLSSQWGRRYNQRRQPAGNNCRGSESSVELHLAPFPETFGMRARKSSRAWYSTVPSAVETYYELASR